MRLVFITVVVAACVALVSADEVCISSKYSDDLHYDIDISPCLFQNHPSVHLPFYLFSFCFVVVVMTLIFKCFLLHLLRR